MSEYIEQKEIILDDILTPKTKIYFSINNSNILYTTTVRSVNGSEVVLAFPEIFAVVEVILGDILSCKFSNNKYEFSFDGQIQSIKVDFPQQIKIKALDVPKKFENIRQSERKYTIFPANLLDKEGGEPLYACVCDVSSTGIRVISKHNIPTGKEVEVHIVLPLRNVFDSVVKMKGKVTWEKVVNNRNEYGIAITEMDELYRKRIEQFLSTYGA